MLYRYITMHGQQNIKYYATLTRLSKTWKLTVGLVADFYIFH